MITPTDSLALEGIRHDQARLRELVGQLDQRIDVLSHRFEEPEPATTPPPLMPRQPSWHEEPAPQGTPPKPIAEPPPLPAVLGVGHSEPPAPTPLPESGDGRAGARPSEVDEPLELRVGTYWMARIGIVILLTGLVFLGNYAYHRIIPLLGAWGKLGLLALAGVALGGVGAWLERSLESMRNYGRVLFAGGAATIYYTVYAAHFVDALRVIQSPVLGGALLLALAGGFLWHAERKRSEALALPAVLLAYYTSSINSIGGFTLFSNLLLTAAAVYFLLRHRWTRLTYASLVATYGSYAFWRFHQVMETGDAGSQFGMGVTFLAGYWVLFTAAVFFAARETMRGPERVAFLSANNAAFFAFAAHHFAMHRPDSFWIFALGYGAVLLGLAALAARMRSNERELDGAYLAQGLGVITIGLAAKLTGPRLAVVLAVESTALLAGVRRRHGLIYEIAGGLCALGACGLTLMELGYRTASPVALGAPVAALLCFNAWWIKRQRGGSADGRFSERAFAFAALGLVVVTAVLWRKVDEAWQPTAFALAAVLSLAALRIHLREVALPAQGWLFLGVALFITRTAETAPAPWWSPLPVVIVALGLLHWWQRQHVVKLNEEQRTIVELAFAGAAVATGIWWMQAFCHGDTWLWAASAAAFGTLLYGWFAGSGALAMAGQVFSALASISFAGALVARHPAWYAAFAPVLNLALTSLLLSRVPAARSGMLEAWSFPRIAQGYRIAAMALLSAWAWEYVGADKRVAFFAGVGAAQMLFGTLSANRERAITGAVYAAAGLALYWTRSSVSAHWLDLFAILAVPASLRVGRWMSGEAPLPSELRNGLVIAAMASVWLWVTRWVNVHGHGEQTTTAWAVLALLIFAAGLGLRERIYRIGGFGVLGLAVGRLFVVDVWRFDTLPRIVSFLVLGAVLLFLSFVYNRFAEAMRRWL